LRDIREQFNDTDLQKFNCLEHIDNGELYWAYLATINTSDRAKINSAIILEARSEPYESRTGNIILKGSISYFLMTCIWLGMILIPKLDKPAVAIFIKSKR
jgi:hypothetical protein